MMPLDLLVADPPWRFADSLPGAGRGASKHYDTMPVEAIMRYPIPLMARTSILLLWRVASMQQEALDVARAWGFTVKSEIVWVKPRIGMGRYVRNAHEVCLVAARGRASSLVTDRAIRSTFAAPVGAHSAKPDVFYEIAERMVPDGPWGELFARRARAGWEQWGRELPGRPERPEVMW